MTRSTQTGVLGRFRRYQHLLMYGGGAALSVVVLAAQMLDVASTVRAYTTIEYQALSLDVRSAADFNARAVATMRNNVQNVELAWKSDGRAQSGSVERFLRDGQSLRVQQAPDALPVTVLGASSTTAPGADVERFIRLADQLSGPLATVAARNGGELTTYLYSADRSLMLLSISPPRSAAQWRTLLADRSTLFAALAGNDGAPLVSPAAPAREPGTARPFLHWLPPYESPLTGQRSLRIAAQVLDARQRPFGVAVVELPVTRITQPLEAANFNGAFFLLGRDGTLIASASPHATDAAALQAAREFAADGAGKATDLRYRDGHWVALWPLGDAGWRLVYVQSWREVAAGVLVPLATSFVTTGVIIAATWLLLLLFNRRVFKPALERSQRVFESEQLSRTLIETAPVGLGLISTESGTPLLRSPAMIETAERLVLAMPTLSAELAARYRRRGNAPEGGGVVHDELTLPVRDGGTIDLAVSVAPARYQGADVLVSAFTDVTAKKRLEQQLRDAKRAAESANAAKSTFLATMSHEIRTPLNAILGNLELLSHSRLDALQRDRLKTIRASSDGLLAIISDVLDFSKIEAGEMALERTSFDVVELASRSLTMFGPIARAKGLRLAGVFGTSATLPMTGDPTRLAQVMNNLLSNAIKFTKCGDVTLRLSVDAPGRLSIDVEDSGIGVTAEQQAVLFQPFMQADATINRRFGGTGLGLALCERLTQAMGGTIAVRSEAGAGSCFTVRVPLGVPAAQPETPRFAGQTVLFLAAEDVWHAYAVPALAAWGLTVHAYRHPAQIDEAQLDDADALIVCGERDTWHVDDENRLFEDASWVIDSTVEGPAYPVAAGRVLSVSSYGLAGLAAALAHALLGEPLDEPVVPRRALARRLRVLVAEDNSVNRELFAEQLKLLGCDVTLAADGAAALEWLSRERFDVLLTDLSMPRLDGYALVREVRARWPSLPIVVATASVTLEERARCEAAGIGHVVTKPLSLARLSATLAEAAGMPQADGEPLEPAGGVETETETAPPASPGGRLMGGREMPDAVRVAFLHSCDASLDALRAAERDGDAPRLLAELHSLRGALAVFGMKALGEQCARLQQQVRNDGLRAAAGPLDALDTDLRAGMLRQMTSPAEVLAWIVAYADRLRDPADRPTDVVGIARVALAAKAAADADGDAAPGG
jgi:two-component system capsular synthesis sensor histidine kinase RcsC